MLLQAHRPLLHHQTHDFVQRIRRRHGRQLGIGIIRRRHLHDIRGDEIDSLEPSNDGPQFPSRPPARLRRARRRGEGRIQGVDIDAEVDRFGGPDTLPDLADDALGADAVDFAGLDNLEAAVAVVVVVAEAAEGGADPGMDVAVVGEETFFVRVVEVCPVIDGGLFGGGAAEDFGLPGVEVGVEMDYGNGTVRVGDAAEQRQGDGVVAPKRDNSREGLAGLGVPAYVGIRLGLARKEGIVACFDLFEGVCIVVGGHGDVSAIEHGGPAIEGIRVKGYIVAATDPQSAQLAESELGKAISYYRFSRREPCLMPEGPNRAPGRYDVPVSKGAPVT